MSNGAPTVMHDASARVDEEEKPKKHHSGPRKRRPKKKPSTRDYVKETSQDTALSPSIRPLGASCDDLQTQPGLCASAEPFTPLKGSRKLLNKLVTSPLDPELQESSSLINTPERALIQGEQEQQAAERAYWTEWVIEAAEKERARRLNVLKQLQCEEEEEVQRRRQWAIATIEKEQEAMMREMFLDNMKNTQWFQTTISRFAEDYEVVCPNSWFGCTFSCMLKDLESHLERCVYRQVPDTLDQVVDDTTTDFYSYDVVCPNAVLGCKEICSRENLAEHLANCPVNGISREKEWEERLEWRRSVIQATEKERERRIDEERAEGGVDGGGLSFGNLQRLYEEQTAMMHVVLHDEIVDFYHHRRQEVRERRPWIQKAITFVTEEIQHVWNQCAQVERYGSFATSLHGGASDVDLVVFGTTKEFNLTSQQCVTALAERLQGSSAFVDVSAITHASIPLLKVVVLVTIGGDEDEQSNVEHHCGAEVRIPFDITFDEPNGTRHNGVASVTLVQGLASAFYGLRELTLVLKHFLVERGLNDPYIGGLSSYGLLLMVVYVLHEQGALISQVEGQKLPHDFEDEDDLNELKPATPFVNYRSNMRYEAQCLKGELVAKQIIKQCAARQQPKKSGEAVKALRKKTKRAVFPSFIAGVEDEGEHETKPYLLGKLLMDFLQFYGNGFRQNLDQISILSWDELAERDVLPMEAIAAAANARSVSPPHSLSPSPPVSHSSPPIGRSRSNSPLALAPPLSRGGLLVIEDPLQFDNNVGKSCYRVSQVFRDFSDFLSFLTALIVRGSVMITGKKKKGETSIATSSSTPSSNSTKASTATKPQPTYRILTSVFEMKKREKRASLDFSSTPA